MLRVQLSELVAALRPGPARALAALSSLLPRLAAATHNAFISSVQVGDGGDGGACGPVAAAGALCVCR